MARPDWPSVPYRIKRGQRGFSVWKFRDWEQDQPGWRVLKSNLTSEAAEQDVLQRMGLAEPVEAVELDLHEITYVWCWPYP